MVTRMLASGEVRESVRSRWNGAHQLEAFVRAPSRLAARIQAAYAELGTGSEYLLDDATDGDDAGAARMRELQEWCECAKTVRGMLNDMMMANGTPMPPFKADQTTAARAMVGELRLELLM